MKVTIIKGPLFEQQEKKAHELLYHMISAKVKQEKPETNKASQCGNEINCAIRRVRKVSFTIKCNKCGNEQEFKHMGYKIQDNISVLPYVIGTFQGDILDTVDIQCESSECDNEISLKV